MEILFGIIFLIIHTVLMILGNIGTFKRKKYGCYILIIWSIFWIIFGIIFNQYIMFLYLIVVVLHIDRIRELNKSNYKERN